MQGNIIVTSESGDVTLPYSHENHTKLIAQLAEQNAPITKLVFENIEAQPSEFTLIFNALKNNRNVTEIKFNHCQLENDYIKNEIASLTDLPVEILTKTNQDPENALSSQPDPRKIISALTLSRNYALKQVTINEKEFSNTGLEVNKALESWHPSNSSIYDLYRFVASYYLSLATQFNIQKQFTSALNYAVYGQLMLKQIPAEAQNLKDPRTAIKFSILLGDLYAKKEMRELAEKRYSEADLIEKEITENSRTDENWRNLLVINSSIAKVTEMNKTDPETSDCFQRAITALTSFCRIKEKKPSDYVRAGETAKIISNTGSVATAFMYHAIFEMTKTQYNINEKISEIRQELHQTKYEKVRDLFIELLISILKEQESTLFPNQLMREYLQNSTNKQILEKALVNLTMLGKYSNPTTPELRTPNDTPITKKAAASYYSSFFESKTKTDDTAQVTNDEYVKPAHA